MHKISPEKDFLITLEGPARDPTKREAAVEGTLSVLRWESGISETHVVLRHSTNLQKLPFSQRERREVAVLLTLLSHITMSAAKQIPIVCPGHTRPLAELQFLSIDNNNNKETLLISACHDRMPMLRNGTSGDWIGK